MNLKYMLVLSIFTLAINFIENVVACENKILNVANDSEQFEKINNNTFLVKSAGQWFHLSQDKECWIKVRHLKNSKSENKKHK